MAGEFFGIIAMGGAQAAKEGAEPKYHRRQQRRQAQKDQYRKIVLEHPLPLWCQKGRTVAHPPLHCGNSTRELVPTGRFELPHLAALAPQASVSTSSTTSAKALKDPWPAPIARAWRVQPASRCRPGRAPPPAPARWAQGALPAGFPGASAGPPSPPPAAPPPRA